MSAIGFDQRVLVLGQTRSGKSVLLNMLTSGLIRSGGAQVLLFDTKPEYRVPGVTPISDIAEADWSAPVIHMQMAAPSVAQVQRTFDVLQHRRRLTVVVHEASDLCEFSAGKMPPAVGAYLSKGAAFGLGLWAGSQRPVNIPPRLLSEADHTFAFAAGFAKRADQDAVAEALEMDRGEMVAELRRLRESTSKHAFLHFDRADGQVFSCPPLKSAELRGIMVESPTLY